MYSDPFRRHEFAADVAFGDEGIVVVQPRQAFVERLFQFHLVAAGHHGFQVFDFRVALQYLEPGSDLVNAVVDGFQLGRLVDHVFRRRHLAAVVQQSGDVHFVFFLVGHGEAVEDSFVAFVRRVGQHHRQFGHALAVPPRVGGLGVDRGRDQLDEGIEQILLGLQKLLVVQGHRRLGRQRLDQGLNAVGERNHRLAVVVAGVDELQNADDVVLVVLQGHGQKRHGPVAGAGIEVLGARKIELPGFVGVGDVLGSGRQRHVGGDVLVVGVAVLVVHAQRRKGDDLAGGPAHGDVERIVAHDLELQLVVLGAQVKRAAVGVAEVLGLQEDGFHQHVVVAFRRQRDADFDQPLHVLGNVPALFRRGFAAHDLLPRSSQDGSHGNRRKNLSAFVSRHN